MTKPWWQCEGESAEYWRGRCAAAEAILCSILDESLTPMTFDEIKIRITRSTEAKAIAFAADLIAEGYGAKREGRAVTITEPEMLWDVGYAGETKLARHIAHTFGLALRDA